MKVAVFGSGYWATFQVRAWQALGVEIVAVWNRTSEKAVIFAKENNIQKVFQTPEEVFEWGEFDIADIIADVGAHERLVAMAARFGKGVICQKPMSDTLESCRRMADLCLEANVWFAIHENFRYQPATLALKKELNSGIIGEPLRAHLSMRSPDLDIMAKQPALTTMPHMVLRDMGPHMFDVARFLFGEMESIFALPVNSYPQYDVPDTALCTLRSRNGMAIHCDLVHSWNDRFFVEGTKGSITLDHEQIMHIETGAKKIEYEANILPQLSYIPEEDLYLHGTHIFASIPNCLQDLREAWMQKRPASTSGVDNLKTMELVFAAIQSFDTQQSIKIGGLL